MVKLEKVVEELKEEIWELDTNNRLIRHGTSIVKKGTSILCTTTERGNMPAIIIRNNLVFYGIREEAATSPEAAVRDVIKRFLSFCHFDHPGLVVKIECSALIFNLLVMI